MYLYGTLDILSVKLQKKLGLQNYVKTWYSSYHCTVHEKKNVGWYREQMKHVIQFQDIFSVNYYFRFYPEDDIFILDHFDLVFLK